MGYQAYQYPYGHAYGYGHHPHHLYHPYGQYHPYYHGYHGYHWPHHAHYIPGYGGPPYRAQPYQTFTPNNDTIVQLPPAE